MTRFLMTLDRAVDTIFAAMLHARRGEIFVPRVPSARMLDVVDVPDRRPADRDRHDRDSSW
jgi:FlaA1/EpsC-like NDP-sugar epimerase